MTRGPAPPGRAPTRVGRRRPSARMAGIDKLLHRPRPADARLDPRRAPRRPRRRSGRPGHGAGAVDAVAGPAMAAARRGRVVAGGARARTRWPPACADALEATPAWVATRGGPRPRRRPAAASAGAGRPGRGGRRGARCRHPGAAGRRDAQAHRRRGGRGTVDRAGLAAAQTPQGVRRGTPAATRRPFRRGADDVHRRGRPARGRGRRRPCDLRRAGQPQGDRARGPRARRGLARVPARRCASGWGTTAIPSGPATASPRRHRASRGRPASTATPTATSCSTPSPTRCSAPPGRATSAGCSRRDPRARGIASAELLAEVVGATRGGRAGGPSRRRLRSVGARPRLGARGSTHAGRDRGAPRPRPDAVNVKASTGNLSGDEGAGRSISAQAVAIVGRRMSIRFRNTLSGDARGLRADRPGNVPDLQLRPDGLRPGAHRQLPDLPVRGPAASATCATAGCR